MEKANPFPSETVDAHWKNSETVRTLRFKISLTESDDKKCPEFSFLDLVKTSTSNDTPEKTPWKEDGEEENLRALAKKFEEKYAPKSKKRRRDRVEDLIDVTYGYDETDPFVDDSEAHDEFISADWTTEHGGFYINQGILNFRPLSPAGESEDEDFKKPKKVKTKTPKKIPKVPKVKKVKDPSEKKERKKSTDKEKKPRKSSSGEKDKEKKHKKKLSMGNANITNLLSSPSSTAKNILTSGTTSSNQALSPSVVSQGPNSASTSQSSPAKSLNSQLSNHGIVKTEPGNSVMVHVNGNNSVAATENMSSTQPDKVVTAPSNTSLQNGIQSGEGNLEIVEPTLPQCLPADLESCILRLKQAGSDSGTEGKCKFFNSDVNHMLLELQTKSRTLSGKVQSGIYEFLAYYLPCTKETLKKRAKNLLINEQAARLREPMAKLKAAVDRVIPEQVKRFEEEVKRHVEEESQKQSSAKQDGENADDHKKELFKSAMELVEENEKSEEITTPTDPNAPTQPEDKTKKNVPKRKFIWTDELRQLLCDVVEMKIKIFEMSKTRAQSAEEHLKVFFENDVRPLWPKGWMTSRILFKESKQAHGKYTSVPARVYKKAPGPKKQGESPENQDSNVGIADVKDMASVTPSVVGTGSNPTITAPAAVPAVSASLATTAMALSVLKTLAQSDRVADIKPTKAALSTVIPVHKPVATAASVTKMETTAVSRSGPEQKPHTVSVIAELNLAQKDTTQKPAIIVKSPPLSDSLQSKPAVTILDFADMMMPQGQTETSKLLHSQQATPPKQPLASFLNKTTSSPKEKPRDQLLTHLPSSVITTTTISLPIQSSTISPARTQITMSSPPKIIRSSPVVVQSTSHSGLMAASVGSLAAKGLPNNFIDLAASSLMQQQQAAVSLAAPSQTILDTITSPRRPVDLKSCQATHSGFVPGLSPQSIAMSLTSPMTSQALHQPQPQPPNLTLFGAAANLHGKTTTPLTHIGIVPSNLQSAMLHLSRQQQQQQEQQSGIVLPQNHFNPVLLGMNPTANQSLPSLQLPHGALLSNQPVFQDPNQTSSSGTHPSPFLPRFS